MKRIIKLFAHKKVWIPSVSLLVLVIAGLIVLFNRYTLFPGTMQSRYDRELAPLQKEGIVSVYPQKITGNLNNSGMGWVGLEEPSHTGDADVGASGDMPEISNMSVSTAWNYIETADGVYDWSNIDNMIHYWTAKGKHINLRIVTDSLILPNTYEGAPVWLIKNYNIPYETLKYDSSAPVTTYKAIDVRNATYQKYLARFLTALSNKYADNPMVDVVEIRGFGIWGEWHSGHSFASYDEREQTLAKIIDAYTGAFQKAGKLLVLDAAEEYQQDTQPYTVTTDYSDYIKWSSYDYAMQQSGVTFRRDDGAGNLQYTTDSRLLSDFIRSGKRLPLLAEYFTGVSDAVKASTGFSIQDGINDILFKMRPNYITELGWKNSEAAALISTGKDQPFTRGNEKMGYRLAVDYARYEQQVRPGGTVNLLTGFSNSGVGRFWYKDPLKVYLLDKSGKECASILNSDFDARTLLNGDTTNFVTKLKIPESVKEGTYKIALAIVDSSGKPAIQLGMAGKDDQNRYVLGKIDVKKSAAAVEDGVAGEMSFDKAKEHSFKPNTVYSITFGYTPHFDVKNYKFGSDDGYVFELTSSTGGKAATAGYTKWQDVSGEHGYKTVLLSTGNYNDYKLNISGANYAGIDITGVRITEMTGLSENFDHYDFTDASSVFMPSSTDSAKLSTQKQAIGGSSSILMTSKKKGDTDCLAMDQSVYRLKANTTYTVAFDYKATTDVGNGGYMYLRMLNGGTYKNGYDIGEWYERPDAPVTRKTYTFTTDRSSDNVIAFGVHNTGSCLIDNLVLTEQQSGAVVSGENLKDAVNQPRKVAKTVGDTEDFENENLSMGYSIFNSGANNWGHLTTDKNLVIDGQVSLIGQTETALTEWYEFAHTRADVIKLAANKYYRVSLKYKVIQNPQDGYFYMSARSDKLGNSKDVGFTKLMGNPGEVKQVNVDFQVGDADDYYVLFGMHNQGVIVIDDVKITQLPDAQVFNGKIDFESGSTILSHVQGTTMTGLSTITDDASKVIDGKYSLYANNDNGTEWYDFMYTDKKSVNLKANTDYKVTFKYRVVNPTPSDSKGFMVFARSDTGGVSNDVGTANFTGALGTVHTQTIRFKTKNFDDYYLAFDINKGGAVVIDDISISEAEPLLLTGTHTFEEGSLQAEGFKAADGGTITDSYNISGKYSVLGQHTGSEQWYDYLRTDNNVLTFKPNTTYQISFKYAIITPTPADSVGFQFFVRSDQAGVAGDLGLTRWNGIAGAYGTKTVTITTGNYNDYFLSFGMHLTGSIVIDDITVKQQ